MYIKFVKNHVSGIEKGTLHNVDKAFGERMISGKYAQESDLESFDNHNEGIKATEKEIIDNHNAEGLKEQEALKKETFKERLKVLEEFEGHFDKKELVLNTNDNEFSELLKKAQESKKIEAQEITDKLIEEKKKLQDHSDEIHSMSIDDLKKYAEENDINIEVSINALQSDYATLILLAEEESTKKKNNPE